MVILECGKDNLPFLEVGVVGLGVNACFGGWNHGTPEARLQEGCLSSWPTGRTEEVFWHREGEGL